MVLSQIEFDLICLFLTTLYLQLFSGDWASADNLIPWNEVETRMFALNMVSRSLFILTLLCAWFF